MPPSLPFPAAMIPTVRPALRGRSVRHHLQSLPAAVLQHGCLDRGRVQQDLVSMFIFFLLPEKVGLKVPLGDRISGDFFFQMLKLFKKKYLNAIARIFAFTKTK